MRIRADLRTLQCFVAVAHERNVSRAAQILNLTQPAVSLQLKRLATETGLTLFRRNPNGVTLTREGSTLLVKAEVVLNALAAFSQTARALTGKIRGRLRIGTIVDPDFTRLGQLLSLLVEVAPELETELLHGMSGDVPERLLRNEIDAGFYLGELPSRSTASKKGPLKHRFLQQQLTSFNYRVVAPPGWDLNVLGKDWLALAALPWITTPAASVHHRLLSKIFADHGVALHSVALVDQEPSMLAMVKSGVGLSLCRESIALHEQQTNGLVVADAVQISTHLSFIALETRRKDPKIACVLDVVRRIWR